MTAMTTKRYKWTDEEKEAVLDLILPRLSTGEPLAVICREEGMPGLSTVYDWRDQNEDIAGRIARARLEGEEALAAETLSIADDASTDFRHGPKGTLVETDSVQRAKLRIHTRFQLLARWNPDKWGEKARTHAPAPPAAPQVLVVGIEPKGMRREALEGEAVAIRVLEKPD